MTPDAAWSGTEALARVNGLAAETEGCPRLLGMRFLEAAPDRLVAEMVWRKDLTMVYGVLHGGAAVGFAATVAGCASRLRLGDGQVFQTVDLQASYLRGCREGVLRATAPPLHVGRRVHAWTVEVRDGQARLVAHCKVTQLVMDGRP